MDSPLLDPTLVAQAAPALHEVAVLLRTEPGDARPVALVWRLICDGVASPLHLGHAGDLRAELARLRFVFRAGRGQ